MFYCKIYLNNNFRLICFLFTIVIVFDFSGKYDARGNRCIAISRSTYWIPRNEIYTNWRRYRCHVYVYVHESMNIHATKNIRRPERREYRYPRLPNREWSVKYLNPRAEMFWKPRRHLHDTFHQWLRQTPKVSNRK